MINNSDSKKTDVVVGSFLKILAILLALAFLYIIRDVLLLLFVAIILASAITPWVDACGEKKIPRVLSIIGIYLALLGVIAMVVVLFVPALGEQVGQLARNFPVYYQKLVNLFKTQPTGINEGAQTFQSFLQTWSAQLGKATQSIFSTINSIMGGLASLIIILIIAFYITVKKDSTKTFLQYVTPVKYQPYVTQLTERMQIKIGQWLKGQLMLCLIVGVLAYIGLTILGVKYALLLGLIAGITEIVPFIGPIIGAIPAIILGFVQAPLVGLLVVILYILIQQLENNIIVPQVMKKTVGLNPIVTILAIAIGAKLAGVLGAIIAVPLVAALSILMKDILLLKEGRDIGAVKNLFGKE